MRSNKTKVRNDITTDREYISNNTERRKGHRRNQVDRREIERFGYEIMTRRKGNDRRGNGPNSLSLV